MGAGHKLDLPLRSLHANRSSVAPTIEPEELDLVREMLEPERRLMEHLRDIADANGSLLAEGSHADAPAGAKASRSFARGPL